MSPEEMKKIGIGVGSAYAGNSLPWMDPLYRDGIPV